MRRATVIFLACSLVCAAVAPAVGGLATAPSDGGSTTADDTTNGSVATVTLLSYNDIQTAAAEDGNFSRLATAIGERRAATRGTVVVGAGDEVGPHALSPVSQHRAPVDVLNTVDPAADTIGNHEFDYGYDGVANITDRSTFPWLATNIVNRSTGEPFQGTDEHVIVERNGVRVGLIGLIDRGAAEGKTNVDFSAEGAAIQNYTQDGPATARDLKRTHDVDVVVALAHTGVPDARRLAEADEGDHIDVIAVGDDERRYPPQAEPDGTIITEAEARARFLSELSLRVNTTSNDVESFDGQLRPVGTYAKNDTASRIITDYRAEVSLDSPAGNTTTPLDSTFASNYHRETAYGNLITDAMRAETGATVAITNAGGIRSNTVYAPNATADTPVPVTGGDVFSTLPFPNTLVTYELTGRDLRAVLASQVVTLESDTGQQFGQEISQQVSGVRFEWVAHDDADPRIRDLYVNTAGPDAPADWQPVEDDETYTVTVNSFIAAGGSGYPLPENETVVSRTDKLLAVTVIDYLEQRGTVSPAVEGRMVRVDRELPARTVTLDGTGKVVLRYDRPEDLETLDADSVGVTTAAPGGDVVRPEQVTVNDDRLILRFDDGQLRRLGDADADTVALDLAADYASSRYADERVYFADSRLNGDLTAEHRDRRGR